MADNYGSPSARDPAQRIQGLTIDLEVGKDDKLEHSFPDLRRNQPDVRDQGEMEAYGVVAFAGTLGKLVFLQVRSERLARQPTKFGLQQLQFRLYLSSLLVQGRLVAIVMGNE